MVNFNNEVLVSRTLTELPLHTVIRSEHIIVYIIESGAVRFTVDGHEHVGTESGYIILLPGSKMIATELMPGFRMRTLQMSPAFIERFHLDDDYRIYQQVLRTPFIPLQRKAFNAFIAGTDMIRGCILMTDNPNRGKMIHHICMAYFYALGHYTFALNDKQNVTDREEEITRQFVEQVRFQFREHHDVAFYAELLHITPKYLSACVKRTLRLTAKYCIDEQIMHYAMTLLKETKHSVSEIAYELHFPDQSAFGKFFRTHTGVGPKEWRAQYSR